MEKKPKYHNYFCTEEGRIFRAPAHKIKNFASCPFCGGFGQRAYSNTEMNNTWGKYFPHLLCNDKKGKLVTPYVKRNGIRGSAEDR